MSYYDVLEFMEDTQKLPCSFLFDIPNCGHLEGTAEKHLHKGATLELPFWLGATLAARELLTLNLPRPYTARVRNALVASPPSVNLRNLGGGGGAFYAGGSRLVSLIEDDQLVKVLEMSFKARMGEVMDQSQHTSADSGGEGAAYEFCQGLDSWERELFYLGETSARTMRKWALTRKK